PSDANSPPAVWKNPLSSSTYALGGYAANSTALGAYVRASQPGNGPPLNGAAPGKVTRNDLLTPANCTDGLSNTIFFTEKYALCNDTTADGFNVWPYSTQSSGSVKRMPIFAYHSSVTGTNGPNFSFQAKPTTSGASATCNGYLPHAPRTSG